MSPSADLGVLGDVRGVDVVELGCGTAYLSAQLAWKTYGPRTSPNHEGRLNLGRLGVRMNRPSRPARLGR
jgi:hypothetical protein